MIDENAKPVVCPESTLESANRRSFIRKAALATTALGIGGTFLGKSVLPESSAESASPDRSTRTNKSSTTRSVTTDTPLCNLSGDIAVFDGESDITGAFRNITANLCGEVFCHLPILSVHNTASRCVSNCVFPGNAICATASCCGTGVAGSAESGIGIYGTSCTGCGVYGNSCQGAGVFGTSHNNTGVFAFSCKYYAVMASSNSPITASFRNSKGASDKTAAVEIQSGCCISWKVGVGGSGNSQGLIKGQYFLEENCVPKVVVNTCGKVGIATAAPNATLQVNGGLSVGTVSTAANYKMSSSNYAVLANAASEAITVTLPPASNTGQIAVIKKIDASTNKVTIARRNTDTIEGATSKTLATQYKSMTLLAGGNGIWYVIATGS